MLCRCNLGAKSSTLNSQGDIMNTLTIRFAGICTVTTALALALALTPQLDLWAADDDIPEFTHDGLQRVIDSNAKIAYVKPDADFSSYNRFMILDCYVAFKKNWQREYNRTRSASRVRDKDIDRMRKDMAEAFRDVFVTELTENGGYEIVDAPAGDALLIRPAIIDLVVNAPDTKSASRSYAFVNSAGAATLYIELYDSVSGEILARAIDRKADHNYITMQWATRASNRSDAKRILRKWAGWLRERMDEVHGKAG